MSAAPGPCARPRPASDGFHHRDTEDTEKAHHRDASFGTAYGVLIKELRLLARAVFVVDSQRVVRHVELVGEVTEEPDYEAALAAVRALTTA